MSKEEKKVTDPEATITEENEGALRTMLADVWQDTIAPHELEKGFLNKTQIEPQMTIVTGGGIPAIALEATLVGADAESAMSQAERGHAQTLPTGMGSQPTLPTVPEIPDADASTADMATLINPNAAADAAQTADPNKTVMNTGSALPNTIMGIPPAPGTVDAGSTRVETETHDPRSTSQQARGSTIASTSSRSSAALRSATAGAMVKAAQALATASMSRMVVQEKIVIEAAQEGDTQMLRNIQPDYEIQKLLGKGGMGNVYAARQTSIDRDIALKMIKPKLATNRDIQTVFLAEAAVTGELEHPNIIPIYELGIQENGVLFYSMKQTKGVEWKKILKEKNEEHNLDTLMKVSDAVAFAHSKGIIHRDLKPENIMLGEFGEVLVMDWGLAASVVDGGKIGKITKANAAGGTPAYMAPEMVVGDMTRIGIQSDVYLLGAILYEIVTGKRPHYAKKMMDLLYNIAKNKIEPTDKKGELVDIALKAMASEPKNRYQTVKDFQDAVRSALEHSESIVLADNAKKALIVAEEKLEYDNYSQALFGFQEALNLWDQNEPAQQGVEETRISYALAAMKKEDIDLAASLVKPIEDKHPELKKEVKRLSHAREARQFRFKALVASSVALVAIVIIGLTTSYFIVKQEQVAALAAKDEAIKSNEEAQTERQKAVTAKLEAEEQREAAVKAKAAVEKERKIAIGAKKLAEVEKDKAIEAGKQAMLAKEEADQQRKAALKSKEEAVSERKAALAAKDDAERQRQQAFKAKEDAELQRGKAEKQQKIAQEQTKVANERLSALTKIGGLKKRVKRSLTPVEAKQQQTQVAKEDNKEVLMSLNLNKAPLNLTLIPKGEFVMGSDIDEKYRAAEEYLHAVTFSKSFYMGQKEISQAQWHDVTGIIPAETYDPTLHGDLPAVNVSFVEISETFLPKLQTFAPKGYAFRLPTEAEWEYACRAGTYSMFQGGSEASLDGSAWYQENSKKKAHPIGTKSENAWGIFDMHGNASEICLDSYSAGFYLKTTKENPQNKTEGKYRIVRGGSWINLPQHCRSAYRSFVHPLNKYEHMGFRVVLVEN